MKISLFSTRPLAVARPVESPRPFAGSLGWYDPFLDKDWRKLWRR